MFFIASFISWLIIELRINDKKRKSEPFAGYQQIIRIIPLWCTSRDHSYLLSSFMGVFVLHCLFLYLFFSHLIRFAALRQICEPTGSRPCFIKPKEKTPVSGVFSFGAPPGTRTLDPLIKSQLLYQLS